MLLYFGGVVGEMWAGVDWLVWEMWERRVLGGGVVRVIYILWTYVRTYMRCMHVYMHVPLLYHSTYVCTYIVCTECMGEV